MDLKMTCKKTKLANELCQRNYKEHSDKAKSWNFSFARYGNTTEDNEKFRGLII